MFEFWIHLRKWKVELRFSFTVICSLWASWVFNKYFIYMYISFIFLFSDHLRSRYHRPNSSKQSKE